MQGSYIKFSVIYALIAIPILYQNCAPTNEGLFEESLINVVDKNDKSNLGQTSSGTVNSAGGSSQIADGEVDNRSAREQGIAREELIHNPKKFFVGENGKDTNLCTDQNYPCKTISEAIAKARSVAKSSVVPGGEIKILEGVYNEMPVIEISGTKEKPFVIYGENKALVKFSGDNLLKGTGFRIKNSNFLIVKNIEILNAKSHGIKINNSNNLRFINLRIHDNQGSGIYQADGSNNSFEFIHSHHNFEIERAGLESNGITLASGLNNKVLNCTLSYNGDSGLSLSRSQRTLVKLNTANSNGKNVVSGIVSKGSGDGFKLGPGLSGVGLHIIESNKTQSNKRRGFNALDAIKNSYKGNESKNNGMEDDL